MTGPEHYREAERLIEGLTADNGSVYIEDGNEQIIALAQVHATLALAAATALAGTGTSRDWREAAGEDRRTGNAHF